MSVTRKTRVPMPEQIRLINECRQSGLTDTEWCRENKPNMNDSELLQLANDRGNISFYRIFICAYP